ncbi:MAG: class I SAM-dependent methyltransferase [Clostridiales bacterium]|nr:class I SAM-dependent methyltransferase [Clostridiales bacterium]
MAHYFDSDPTAASDRRQFEYRVNGINFRFTTDTNVFSRNGVDFGTELMIEEMIKDIKASGRIPASFLDLGCGAGIVGVVMKSVYMRCDVTGVDVNQRAVGLALENAAANGVKCNFLQSDVLQAISKDTLFDTVATNPPVRAGKKTVFAFYDQAYEHMAKNGIIYVVLQRKQGAPSTEKKLKELFGNCETLGIDGGYRVMKAVKEEI